MGKQSKTIGETRTAEEAPNYEDKVSKETATERVVEATHRQRVRSIPRQAGFQLSIDGAPEIIERADKNSEMATVNKTSSESMEQAINVVKSLGKSETSIDATAPIPKKEETSSKSAKKSIEKGARQERVILQSQKLGEMEKDELSVEFEEKFTPKKGI